MNYDDIFGEDIFNEDSMHVEDYYNQLVEIYEKNGVDNLLTKLVLSSCDLAALFTIYNQIEDKKESNDCLEKIFFKIGIVNSIIETFIINNDKVYEVMEEARERYVEKELNYKKEESKGFKINSNRIAYLFKNNKRE